MGKILNFIKNTEKLKICIVDYEDSELEIIHVSNEYYEKHHTLLKRPKEKRKITEREFRERLYNYLWIEKVSEMMILLYLEDLKNNHPTIYELNKFLRRTSKQYPSTFKQIKKLEQLSILYTTKDIETIRKERRIFIKKDVVKIYGDDEFRQIMLTEWDADAKEYMSRRIKYLLEDKEKIEERLKMIKKGRRP
jgi:hypothetical protein